MGRTYRGDPTSKRHAPVDPECVKRAVDAVKQGMSVRLAAKKYGISKSALQRYSAKLNLQIRTKGGQTALPSSMENDLVTALVKCSDWGYPLSTFDIRCFVKFHLDREGKVIKKFKDNLPGRDWALSFLKRNKKLLSQRMCQNIKGSRASVSPDIINDYFDNVTVTLKDIPSHLIINYDESCLADDPGRRKLIFRRGCKYPERVLNESKTGVTVLFAATASGILLPPYTIYKAVHIYDLWIQGGPEGAHYNRSKSGWIDGFCFLDWIQKIIVPYCRRFQGRKVLIGDNLSSHLSPTVVKICVDNDISFVFLPANSTSLTQPLDVAVFRPLKIHWRLVLEKWKIKTKNSNKSFDKKYFPGLLKQTLDRLKEKDGLKNDILSGFAKSGLVPLNRERVLGRLPPVPVPVAQLIPEGQEDQMSVNDSLSQFLKEMRYGNEDTEVTRSRKKRIKVPPGQSVSLVDFESDNDNEASVDDKDDDTDEETSYTREEENEDQSEDLVQLKEGVWVRVKFQYEHSVEKVFIGKVLQVMPEAEGVEKFVGTFMRQSSKASSIYTFPDVPDECEFSKDQVLEVLNPPDIRRGRHTFHLKK